jgi:hypothetical protein
MKTKLPYLTLTPILLAMTTAQADEYPGVPANLLQKPTEQELADITRSELTGNAIPDLSPEAKQTVAQDIQTDMVAVDGFRNATAEQIVANRNEEQAVDEKIQGFCQAQGVEAPVLLAANTTEPAPEVKEAPSAGSTDIKAPEDTPVDPTTDLVITCDAGNYIDLDQGLVVYFKNVRARHPQVNMDCDNQMKVFLLPSEKKKTEQPEKETKPGDPKAPVTASQTNYDGIKKITADGNVIIVGQNDEGKPFKGGAQHVSYDAVTGDILMTGGKPYFQDENNRIECMDESAYIRVHEGKAFAYGNTTTKIRNVKMQSNSASSDKNKRK